MPERAVPHADETMELPIFRELESAWFRTRKPAAGELAEAADASATAQFPKVQADAAGLDRPADVPTGQYPTIASGNGADQQRSSTMAGSAGMGNMHASNDRSAGYTVPAPYAPAWQTVADDGWAAASAAAASANHEVGSEVTGAGLPKRKPMAQLVPGGVDKGGTTLERRTPEGVRGLLSAYHRGVQRGRTHQKDEDSTAGSNPNGRQAGKEHEA
ncbi:MAG: hypothetical protein HOV79_11650 [Hamadaea sp.]|nr:hypothetical protein [Hamadaea sp.]